MSAYELDGQGPPLLLIHGFGISFNIWKELRPLLCSHFTLIMVELPGIGRTPAPATGASYLDAAAQAIEQVRCDLGLEQWSLLSYSSGTRVAERYVALHPERVRSAAFVCPIETHPLTAALLRLALRWDRAHPRFGDWVLSGARFRFLLNLLGFNFRGGPLLDVWFAEITSQPVNTLKETLRSMPHGGAEKFIVPEGMPCLFVWGREDRITASPRGEAGVNRLIYADHSAPQTAALQVAEALLPFLTDASNG